MSGDRDYALLNKASVLTQVSAMQLEGAVEALEGTSLVWKAEQVQREAKELARQIRIEMGYDE